MNVIIGFSDLLKKPGIPEDKKTWYANLISSGGEQLLRIIDDIIDISKIESNQLKIDKKIFRVNDIVKETIDFFMQHKKKLQKNNVELRLRMPLPAKNYFMNSDPIRFKQILDNLVSNAIKNTDDGFVEIGYDIVQISSHEFLRFYVKDTGIGIAKENFKIIFDRFGQVRNKRSLGGTGIGLSISMGLTKLLGGNLWLESELHKGTTFFFTLPYNSAITNIAEETISNASQKIPDLTGKKIFIAEDDTASFEYIREILSETNVILRHARNGQELLTLLQHELPELILLDINMPVMDGIETVAEIRKFNTFVPVIALSAFAMPEEKEKCLEAGCNEYIIKPINPAVVIEKVIHYSK